jgi:methyl-accepting chemotaxis protein
VPVDLAVFDIRDVSDSLTEPEEGSEKLNHNGAFDTAAELWDDARDKINDGIDLVNGLGVITIERLDVGSLRDYVVYPLSANYARIQQNAAACHVVNKAMAVWGSNFTKLSLKVELAMRGQASLGLLAQMNLYHLAARGIGAGVAAGAGVFDQIALMSERIAVEVEKVLVLLGRKLLSLSAKVGRKLVPGFGWIVTAAEIVSTMGDNIRDIIDDIKEVAHLIVASKDLIDEIKAWAETQAARLEKFQEVLSAVQELPSIGAMKSLGDLPVDTSAIEKTLDDVIEFGDGLGATTDDLEGALGDLDADNEDVDELDTDSGDDDDEDMLMAPGPITGPPGAEPPPPGGTGMSL